MGAKSPLIHMRQPRIGVMVPWANTAVEAELPRLIGMRASIHSARLVPPALTTKLNDDFLLGLATAVPQAWNSLRHLSLQSVAFCCTSASLSTSSIQTLKQSLSEIPIKTFTAYGAIVQQLKELHCSNIFLATPYPKRITFAEKHALIRDGFMVENTISLEYEDDFDDIDTGILFDPIIDGYRGEDAIVISCTGIYTHDLLIKIRKYLNIPCISSNSAIADTFLKFI